METTTPPVEEVVPQTSLWEDFVDIYFAPAQVFARRAAGRFGLALLVLAILSAILAFGTQVALGDALAADMQRAMASGPASDAQLSTENLERMRSFGTAAAVAGTLIAVPVGAIIAGAVLWLLGAAFESALGFGAAIMIATYSAFPRLLQSVTGMVQGLVLDPDSIYDVALGLGRFLPREELNPILLALADRVDVFAIWVAILVAIGVRVVARVPSNTAYLIAGIFWILGALPAMIPALVRQLMG